MKTFLNIVCRKPVAPSLKAPLVLQPSDLKKVSGGLPRAGGLTTNGVTAPPAGTSST
ncbi:MAG: hypothetical protein KGN16_16715 [Burkholderiales bacterium]|nr:hypothetical protein [Burkholderiales bacterium]